MFFFFFFGWEHYFGFHSSSSRPTMSDITNGTDCPTASSVDESWGGGGVLPYIGYIGMCGAKGYGFSAVLVINRVSILATLPPFS